MEWTIAGLGNPGEEYNGTRHNIGRDFLLALAKRESFPEWKEDAKLHVRSTRGVFGGKKVRLLLPNTYMNNSGAAFRALISTPKDLQRLVVLHDELDLALGAIKMGQGSGAGGHRGVESIQKTLKSKDFIRIRIGISPTTPTGKLRKPSQEKIVDFVLGTFRPNEKETLKKVQKKVFQALECLIEEGLGKAMTQANAK